MSMALVSQEAIASAMLTVGQAANQAAQNTIYQDFRAGKASSTLTAHDRDLATFARFLSSLPDVLGGERGASVAALRSITGEALAGQPGAWANITAGLVKMFKRWQEAQGFAISSINRALSTVKVYAGLAFEAGVLDETTHSLIRMVKGYRHKEGRHVDEKRPVTRVSNQKSEAVEIPVSKIKALKLQMHDLETAQGRRDALIMCLLLDHGLRVSELVNLKVGGVDLETGRIRFYRPKVDNWGHHEMFRDTLLVMQRYFAEGDAPMMHDAPLIRASRKGGALTSPGMSRRAVFSRVRQFGYAQGVDGLSPHDCRHSCATRLARAGTQIKGLVDFFGWNSPAMAMRYVEAQAIHTDGVIPGEGF